MAWRQQKTEAEKIEALKARIGKLEHERDVYKARADEAQASIEIVNAMVPDEMLIEKDSLTGERVYTGAKLVNCGGGANLWNDRIRAQLAWMTGTPVRHLKVRAHYVILNRGARPCPDCGETTVLTLHHVRFQQGSGKFATSWHPDTWYISCSCGENAGEHYRTPFEALAGWNNYIEHERKLRRMKARKEAFAKHMVALDHGDF